MLEEASEAELGEHVGECEEMSQAELTPAGPSRSRSGVWIFSVTEGIGRDLSRDVIQFTFVNVSPALSCLCLWLLSGEKI